MLHSAGADVSSDSQFVTGCRKVAEVVPGVLQDFRPDLVLYDAGVDPHHDDKLGRLCLTDSGLMRREMQVASMRSTH